MIKIIQLEMKVKEEEFHPITDDQNHPIRDEKYRRKNFIQILMITIIQLWTNLKRFCFHPNTDDPNRPIMDDYMYLRSLYREICTKKVMIYNA